jgi:hypothetical protein
MQSMLQRLQLMLAEKSAHVREVVNPKDLKKNA